MILRNLKYCLLTGLTLVLMAGCGRKEIVTTVAGSEGPLVIYPDYKEVTIPENIAPLNYRYAMTGVKKASTTFTLGGRSVTIKGGEVEWNLRKWKSFIAGMAGQSIKV
ncbi:MAG: hypothetical protein J6W74_03890, partial [Bacteroidales bacterium]|nr:hypothetical protein [Bacteroidales bacterium]